MHLQIIVSDICKAINNFNPSFIWSYILENKPKCRLRSALTKEKL